MNTIFDKKDFTLCSVPTPKGYPQSQTHVGIAKYGDKYVLTTSPYPNPKYPKWKRYLFAAIGKLTFHKINMFYSGENFENPCVYLSGSNGYPTNFQLMDGRPLMDTPENKYGLGAYCSDPDIFIEGNLVNVLNRTSYRKSKTGVPINDYETDVYLIQFNIENGCITNKKIFALFKEQYASPCLFKIKDNYVYLCLDTNSYNTGEACKGLYKRTSDSLTSSWSDKQLVEIDNGEYHPWHMSVFNYAGKVYSIISCIKKGESHRCWTMLGVFNQDLSSLKIYQTPLSDYKSYRSAGIVNDDGDFILYNTTVHEKIKGGKSVDGREVVMAHMPFNELLKKLKDNE